MQPFIFHHLKINRIVSCGYILMWSTIIAIFRLVSSSFFIIFSLSGEGVVNPLETSDITMVLWGSSCCLDFGFIFCLD
jgi:hypothetical protein